MYREPMDKDTARKDTVNILQAQMMVIGDTEDPAAYKAAGRIRPLPPHGSSGNP